MEEKIDGAIGSVLEAIVLEVDPTEGRDGVYAEKLATVLDSLTRARSIYKDAKK